MEVTQTQQMEDQEVLRVSKTFKRACRKCDHVRVCVVFKAVTKILESHFTKDTKPFKAEDMASICTQYLSVELTASLRGSQQ